MHTPNDQIEQINKFMAKGMVVKGPDIFHEENFMSVEVHQNATNINMTIVSPIIPNVMKGSIVYAEGILNCDPTDNQLILDATRIQVLQNPVSPIQGKLDKVRELRDASNNQSPKEAHVNSEEFRLLKVSKDDNTSNANVQTQHQEQPVVYPTGFDQFGQPIYGQQPVYQQPMNQNMHQQPVYQQPVYQQPVQPNYGQQPVYQQPAQPNYGQQPVYQQPVNPQMNPQQPVYQNVVPQQVNMQQPVQQQVNTQPPAPQQVTTPPVQAQVNAQQPVQQQVNSQQPAQPQVNAQTPAQTPAQTQAPVNTESNAPTKEEKPAETKNSTPNEGETDGPKYTVDNFNC